MNVENNRDFARNNNAFRSACDLVKTGIVKGGEEQTLPYTVRQASKFRRGKGSAYKAMLSNR